MNGQLPEDSAERKTYPIYSGVLAYFPAAIAAVAHHSFLGNEKHNPGEPLHWARGKSDDQLDAAARHLTEGDLTGAAWRILAALQLECEANGAPMAPGARNFIPHESVMQSVNEAMHALQACVDGHPATGGGESSQTLLTAGEFEAPPLTPAQEVLIERADEDAPTAHLKAGEAMQCE